MNTSFIIIVICLTLIAVVSILLSCCIYKLVLIDARNRGIKKPKFWAFIAISGQSGEGLIWYLFKRKRTISNMNATDQKKMLQLRSNIFCLMMINIFASLIFIAALIGLF